MLRPPHLTRAPGAGSAALRQRLRLVVAGDVGAAIEDPGVALGVGAVQCHEFQVEVVARLRLRYEMVMAIAAAHEGGTILAGELRHRRRDIADGKADAPVVRRVGRRAVDYAIERSGFRDYFPRHFLGYKGTPAARLVETRKSSRAALVYLVDPVPAHAGYFSAYSGNQQ